MSDVIPQTDPKAANAAQGAAIEAAIRRVLDSGHYILAEEVAAFERAFARYIGRKYCVGVASGTDALVAAVRALKPRENDFVITVSHTSVATVAAIELAGAKPLLIDVDDATLMLDVQELARVLENPPGRIAAIVPVHLYGGAAAVEAIAHLARGYGVPVIEDCAQCHGARLGERRLGAFGDLAAFSFYPTKNLGAIGDGGAVLTDDPGMAEFLASQRQYGWNAARVSTIAGSCSRLDEIQAAILRVKLERLDADNARRRQIARTYSEAFAGLPLRLPTAQAGVEPVFHQYVVRSTARDALRERLQEQGVQTGIHYPVPVHLQAAYAGRLATGPSGLVRSARAAREVLSLPMFPQLSDTQIERVVAAVSEACHAMAAYTP